VGKLDAHPGGKVATSAAVRLDKAGLIVLVMRQTHPVVKLEEALYNDPLQVVEISV
jgi:hypothetical protein